MKSSGINSIHYICLAGPVLPSFVLYDAGLTSTPEDKLAAPPRSLSPPQRGNKDQADAILDQGPDDQDYRFPDNPELYKAYMQAQRGAEVLKEAPRIHLGEPWNPGWSALPAPQPANMPMLNTDAIPDRECAKAAVR